MKEGTKVKVISEVTGHEFDIGEIVERRFGPHEAEDCIGFYSERNGLWYMIPEEYKIVDKNHIIDMLSQAYEFAVEQKMNEDTTHKIIQAIAAVVED